MANTVRPQRGLPAVLALTLAAALLVLGPLRPAVALAADAAHGALRAADRERVRLQVASWPRMSGSGFTLYYAPGLSADAAVVAAAVRADYPRVMADFGLSVHAVGAQIVVVDPAQMAAFVGAASSDPPLGAYYEGTVWLLAPSAFLPPGPDLAAQYLQQGPAAHELTHLADDLRSGGTVPVWFDEGLAQYEDWRLTGYVWTEPDSGFTGPVYSWTQLTRGFTGLPNVALAYRQALAAVASVCRSGPGACAGVLADLRAGQSMDTALSHTVGAAGLKALRSGAAWPPGHAPQPGTPAGPLP